MNSTNQERELTRLRIDLGYAKGVIGELMQALEPLLGCGQHPRSKQELLIRKAAWDAIKLAKGMAS